MSKTVVDISDEWKLCIEDIVINKIPVTQACDKWGINRQTYYQRIKQSPAHRNYFEGLSNRENPVRPGRPKRTDDITNESLTERAMQIVHAKLNDEKGKIGDDMFKAAIDWLKVERYIKTTDATRDDTGISGNFDKMIAVMEKQMGLKRGELTQRLTEVDNGGSDE